MQQRSVLTKGSPNPFLPITEYRYSMTRKRRQKAGPTQSLTGFRAVTAESPSRRDSVPAGRHEQSRDSIIDAADVSANYDDSPISKNLLSRQETHAAAPNGQRQPSSTNLPSYMREYAERMVMDQICDRVMRKLQQQQAYMQPCVCLLSSGSGGNSVLMDPTLSVKKKWHRSAVHENEASIMTESQVYAPDHPRRLFSDDVAKLFAEIANLVSRLDSWPDTEKIRSISERVHRRISIFNEVQRGIDEFEDRKPAELSIREEMRRKI